MSKEKDKNSEFVSRDVIERRIAKNIDEYDFDALHHAIPSAERLGCNQTELMKAYDLLSQYFTKAKDYRLAIIYSNKARRRSKNNTAYLERLIANFSAFYDESKGKLVKNDIHKLSQCFLFLESYYEKARSLSVDFSNYIQELHNLLVKSQYRYKHSALAKAESPFTKMVDEIYQCIYEEMDEEESYSEIARIIEPVIIEILDEIDSEEE